MVSGSSLHPYSPNLSDKFTGGKKKVVEVQANLTAQDERKTLLVTETKDVVRALKTTIRSHEKVRDLGK